MFDAKDDFRLRRGFLHHPKIIILRRKLGAEGVLSLISLWDFTAGNHYDGSLAGMTDDEIEAAAEWDGEHGAWLACVVALRLVDGEPQCRAVHSWGEHQPWVACRDERIASATHAARSRWDAPRMRPARKRNAVSEKGNAPLPSPPLPSPTQPSQEKNHTAPAEAVAEALTQDGVAKALKTRLGSSLNPCRDQVRALIGAGWNLPRVMAAIEAHAEPGVAPWDWTKRASLNGGGNGHAKVAPPCACGKPSAVLVSGQHRCEVYCSEAEKARLR